MNDPIYPIFLLSKDTHNRVAHYVQKMRELYLNSSQFLLINHVDHRDYIIDRSLMAMSPSIDTIDMSFACVPEPSSSFKVSFLKNRDVGSM